MTIIRRIPNPEHMARSVAAIRERWAQESTHSIVAEAPANVVIFNTRKAERIPAAGRAMASLDASA